MAQYSEIWNVRGDPVQSVNNGHGWESAPDSAAIFTAPSFCGLGTRHLNTATNRRCIRKTGEPNTENAEVQVLVNFTNNTGLQGGPCIRQGGTTSSNFAGVLASVNETRDSLTIYEYVAGTLGTIATVSLPAALSFPYWVKIRGQGSDLYAKAWDFGDPEPIAWQVSGTDPAVLTGRAGYFLTNSGEYIIGAIAVGTNGDVSPQLTYVLSGSVNEDDTPNPLIPLVRTVRAVRRANPLQWNETVSAADGSFSIPVITGDEYSIFVIDELLGDYNALILDKVIPLPL